MNGCKTCGQYPYESESKLCRECFEIDLVWVEAWDDAENARAMREDYYEGAAMDKERERRSNG